MSSRSFWGVIVLVGFSASAHAGILEICKVSDPAGSLADPFYFFTIGGQPGLGSILVPVDACTSAITLPDADYTITEQADPTSTLESVETFPGYGPNQLGLALLGFDLSAGTATVEVSVAQPVELDFTNTPAVVPEPGTAWLLGLGMTVWALRGNLTKRPSYVALRNATKSAVRRAFD